MPAPKPASVPDWATAAAGPDIVAPSAGEAATGWTAAQFPPHNWFNYWQNVVGQWCDWVRDLEIVAHTWSALQTYTAGLTVSAGTTTLVATTITGGATVSGGISVGGGATIGSSAAVTGGLTADTLTVTNHPTITTPLLAGVVADVTGKPRLSYWKDFAGAVHIEGCVNATASAATSAVLWSAGTLPVGSRPSGQMILPACNPTTRPVGAVIIAADGTVTALSLDGVNLGATFWISVVFHPSVPVAP